MAGGVVDGQAVSAGVTNPAFLYKNFDDSTAFKLSFLDTIGVGLSASALAKIDVDSSLLYAIRATSISNSIASEILLRRARASSANLTSADVVANILINGMANGSYNSLAKLSAIYQGDGTTFDTDLAFYVGLSAALNQKMTLKANGNLLIGTTSDGGQILQANGGISVFKIKLGVTTQATTGSPITALTSTNGLVYFTGSTATEVDGISAPAESLSDGTLIDIQNQSSAVVTFKNQSGSASASDRLILPDGADFSLSPGAGCSFAYDLTNARWRFLFSGSVTFTTFGATPNSSGASISDNAITLQPADATNPGGVSILSQSFAGQKTFLSAPILNSLTASRPLKIDGSKIITATQIDLASSNDVTGILGATFGGTGLNTYTTGDILYASATNTLSKLSATTNGFILTLASGIPSWAAPTGTTVTFNTFGSTPNSAGASVSGGSSITLQPADATNGGGVSTTTQTFAGVKTFSSAPNFSSLTASRPLKLDGSKNVTATQIDLSSTNDISNALAIGNGGTGQTTKAAAFDALSPMTTGGDLIYGGASGTGTRLANGSAGQVLTSAGTTLAPTWQTPSNGVDTVASITSNHTITTSENFVTGDATGGSFTLTLFAASGNAGRSVKILRYDNTLANKITVTGTGLSATLMTSGEAIIVESDGSNWYILDRYIPSMWSSVISPTFGSFGTVSNNSFYWKREGQDLLYRGSVTCGTPTSGGATMTILSGLTILSTFIPNNEKNQFGYYTNGLAAGAQPMSNTNYTIGGIFNSFTSTTMVQFEGRSSNNGGANDNATTFLNSGDVIIVQNLRIPITDWQC